jgi:hypothetical protein
MTADSAHGAERLACYGYVIFHYGKPQWRREQAPRHPTHAKFQALIK